MSSSKLSGLFREEKAFCLLAWEEMHHDVGNKAVATETSVSKGTL